MSLTEERRHLLESGLIWTDAAKLQLDRLQEALNFIDLCRDSSRKRRVMLDAQTGDTLANTQSMPREIGVIQDHWQMLHEARFLFIALRNVQLSLGLRNTVGEAEHIRIVHLFRNVHEHFDEIDGHSAKALASQFPEFDGHNLKSNGSHIIIGNKLDMAEVQHWLSDVRFDMTIELDDRNFIPDTTLFHEEKLIEDYPDFSQESRIRCFKL